MNHYQALERTDKNGRPTGKWHYTYATLAFAVNTNPKVVSEIMGHASVAFTLDRYTHMTIDDQQRSADGISERYFIPGETAKSS